MKRNIKRTISGLAGIAMLGATVACTPNYDVKDGLRPDEDRANARIAQDFEIPIVNILGENYSVTKSNGTVKVFGERLNSLPYRLIKESDLPEMRVVEENVDFIDGEGFYLVPVRKNENGHYVPTDVPGETTITLSIGYSMRDGRMYHDPEQIRDAIDFGIGPGNQYIPFETQSFLNIEERRIKMEGLFLKDRDEVPVSYKDGKLRITGEVYALIKCEESSGFASAN